MAHRRTLKTRNGEGERVIIALRGDSARTHLALRDLYPSRTDSDIYRWISENAGTPQKRVLDLVEAILTTWAADLGPKCHATLAVALKEARRVARNEPDARTVQISLSFDTDVEVTA